MLRQAAASADAPTALQATELLVTVIRSVVLGLRRLSAGARPHQCRSGQAWSTPPTSGSRSAPASAQRHIAADGELTSRSRRSAAARAALADAGLDAPTIDLIVLATATPDNTFPATASRVQAALGMHARRRLRRAGGVLRLRLRAGDRRQLDQRGQRQARAGDRRRDLLAHPRLERPRHLRAVRRRRRRGRAGGAASSRARAPTAACSTTHLRSDGRHKDMLYVDGGPSSTRTVGHLRMEGHEVFRHAVGKITDVIEDAFGADRLSPPTTSTGSCRTRPTSASSTASAKQARHRRRRRW